MMSNELNIDKIGNQLNLNWDDKSVIKERKSEKWENDFEGKKEISSIKMVYRI